MAKVNYYEALRIIFEGLHYNIKWYLNSKSEKGKDIYLSKIEANLKHYFELYPKEDDISFYLKVFYKLSLKDNVDPLSYKLLLNEIDKWKNNEELNVIKPDLECIYNHLCIAIKSSKKQKVSYVWQGKQDKELPELYEMMLKKYKLIASETTYEVFKAVFTGQPIDENFEPIKWHFKKNASELLYFIYRLEQSGLITCNSKKADFIKMKACFVQYDGKQFNEVFKSLKTKIKIELSQDKQEVINELVGNFL